MTSRPTRSIRGRHPGRDLLRRAAVFGSAGLTLSLLAGMLLHLLAKGLPGISLDFLCSVPSTLKHTYGILPNIINTVYIIVLTLLIAVPIGVGGAVYLSEYARNGKIAALITRTSEALASLPSILYGLFGFTVFSGLMRLSYSLTAGALTLSLMVFPLILAGAREALKAVPAQYRESAYGLGASKWQMIRTVLLPAAGPGILSSVILSIGRIAGESAALLFTAGAGTKLPQGLVSHLSESGATLSVQLYQYAQRGNTETSYAIAAVLVLMVLGLNLLTRSIQKRRQVDRHGG